MKQLAPLISYSPRGHPKRRSQEIASKWAIPNQFPIGGEDINTTVDHVSVIGKKFQIVVFRDLDDELIVEILSAFSEITQQARQFP